MGHAKETGGWGNPLPGTDGHDDGKPAVHKPGDHAKEPGGWGEKPQDAATPRTGELPAGTGGHTPNGDRR